MFTAQHVSAVFPPIIRSSVTAVAASGFTFYRGDSRAVFVVEPAGRHDHEHSNNLRERDYLGDPGVDGRIILRWISRKCDVGMWTGWS